MKYDILYRYWIYYNVYEYKTHIYTLFKHKDFIHSYKIYKYIDVLNQEVIEDIKKHFDKIYTIDIQQLYDGIIIINNTLVKIKLFVDNIEIPLMY